DLVEILRQHGIGLKKHSFRLLDDPHNQRLVYRLGTFDRDDLFRGPHCGRRGLLRTDCGARQDQHKQRDAGDSDRISEQELAPMMQGYDGSTTRTPFDPDSTTACASPTNRPCSTTPTTASRRSASDFGSAMRSHAASTTQCPPSVTKAWPSG